MTWPFDPLRPLGYGAIVADPPWKFELRSKDQAKGHDRNPEAHYATMGEAEISALPVRDLAGKDCMLFMWTTWPHIEQGLRVMRAWGFRYATGGAWVKRGTKGGLCFGTGYTLRSACEPFLLGTIGEPRTQSKSVRNVIEAVRREHSRKPPEMRAMVEQLLPDAFACELFAREPWPGHAVWGNETAKFSESA